MIKDVFKFSKTSWHMKLMTWIWGFKPEDFMNMCPYFWLSVFNIVFIIPIIVIKFTKYLILGIRSIISTLSSISQEYCDAKEQKWLEERIEELKNNKEARLNLINEYYNPSGLKGKKYTLFWSLELDFVKSMKEERKILLEEKAELEQEKEKLRAKKSTNKRARIGKLTVFIKFLSKIVGGILLIIAGYYIYKGIEFLITLDWYSIMNTVLEVLSWVYAIIGSIGALGLFISLLISIFSFLYCRFGSYCIPCEKRKAKLVKVLKKVLYILYPIYVVWFLLKHTFIFIWKSIVSIYELIIALKQNNCPSIEWKD